MDTKRALTWAGVIIALTAAVGVMIFLATKSDQEPSTSTLTPPVNQDDWIKGSEDAPIALVEYGDFQCPACATYYPITKQLVSEFDEVALVFRHFPLNQHQNAQIASIAAEAAGQQGKFWEMHDMLFANQNEWAESKNPKEIFSQYAQSLNLDLTQFQRDLDSKALENKVGSHYTSGIQSQVTYTPTFFLNGIKITNPQGYENFKQIIQSELQKTSQ